MSETEILKRNTDHTVELLKQELEIKKSELENQWHWLSLERIFIENRIYRDIEEEETWEGVIAAIDKGLKPHIKSLKKKKQQANDKLLELNVKKSIELTSEEEQVLSDEGLI